MHVVNYDMPSSEHGGIQEYIHRIGRTARIGNDGVATSFFNDRNEDIAEDLVKVLMETNQHIPGFLEQYKPDNAEEIDFGDHSEGEEGDGDDAGDGWGAPDKAPADNDWGTSTTAAVATAAVEQEDEEEGKEMEW